MKGLGGFIFALMFLAFVTDAEEGDDTLWDLGRARATEYLSQENVWNSE